LAKVDVVPVTEKIVPQPQAGDVVGLLYIITVSLTGQPLAVIVHLRLVLVPRGTLVTVVVGFVVDVIVPVPLNILHVPLPTEGVTAAIVNVELLH
jgi:hypothetical protein